MRWLLIVYLSLSPGAEPRPVTIPQSTETSCTKAAEKLRKDIQTQISGAIVVTSCIDQGFAY